MLCILGHLDNPEVKTGENILSNFANFRSSYQASLTKHKDSSDSYILKLSVLSFTYAHIHLLIKHPGLWQAFSLRVGRL